MRIAFLVHKFPQISEVFIINQIADLIDRGVEVRVFTLEAGSSENVSERYHVYKMRDLTRFVGIPISKGGKWGGVVPRLLTLLFTNPGLFLKLIQIAFSGNSLVFFRALYGASAFCEESFDLIHCHFGKVANWYLPIRRILKQTVPMVASFYGYDVSNLPKIKGVSYYDDLKRECHHYIVMSNNMKDRVVALGFPAEEITVLPVSIDVDSFEFRERSLKEGERVEILSMGRFTEKKGFDDFLRAVAIVKGKATKPFHATIVGGGELDASLKQMAKDLKIEDVLTFAGYMKVEDVFKLFMKTHLYVQSSKTASNGDME